MHFGATLRLLRVDAGWTLRELADQVGVSNAYLSRVENGHDAPPTPDRLAVIARLVGVSPDTLIELADRIRPTDYLDGNHNARALFQEIARRRLNAVEIARVRAFVEREFPLQRDASAGALAGMLDPARVVHGLSCGDIDDVIDVAATKLAAATGRTAHALREAIAAHERGCSSAIGGGLAVPHAVFDAAEPAAVVVTLRRGLDCDAPDGVPVRLCIVHVHRAGRAHARLLTALARLAEPAIVAAAVGARTPAAIVAALATR